MRWFAICGMAAGFAAGRAVVRPRPSRRTQVRNTYKQVLHTDMRQMSHDWNKLWLADREYRLSRWVQR